jgi:hypothetical protein
MLFAEAAGLGIAQTFARRRGLRKKAKKASREEANE